MKSTFFPHPTPKVPLQRINAQSGKVHPLLLVAVTASVTLGANWLWTQANPASRTPASSPASTNASPSPASAAVANNGNARRFGAGNRAQPVTVGAVEQRDVRVLIHAVGSMSAQNTAIVRAKVDGEVKALHFKEGQLVKAGQLLAELDGRAYEAQLAQAQGSLMRDQAQLRNAQLDLQRYKDLLAKDAIARQQVETQEALVKQLEGSVKADQGAVDNARLSLSYTKVTAPITGVASLKQVDLGTVAHSSDTNGIVTLAQTQPMALVFAIPEAQAQRVLRQMKGKGGLTAEAWDRDMKNRLASGQVVSTDNAIDTATGTLKVKALFANKDNALLPNQFVNVLLQVDTLKDVLAVPDASIQRGPQGTFVYLVQPDSTVNMRRIKLGAQEGELWSVEGELKPGDKVVTDGADRLREGAKVETITPAPRSQGGNENEKRRQQRESKGG
jgi:multidrug efflux system membrane fusion protein